MLPKLREDMRNEDNNKIIIAVNELIEDYNKRMERGRKMAAGKAKKK